MGVMAVGGALAAAVLTTDGYHTRRVDLNDSGVWVMRASYGDVGRANMQAKVIDSSAHVSPTDVWQHDRDVLVRSTGFLYVVDPVNNKPSQPLAIADSLVSYAGGTVAVLEQATGKLHIWPLQGMPSGTLGDDKDAIKAGAGGAVAVGVDGVTHVVSADGTLVSYDANHKRLSKASLGRKLTSPTMTAVGSKAVVLDSDGSVLVEGRPGAAARLTNAVLQQPGDSRLSVLVADDSNLYDVPLDKGEVKRVDTTGTGQAIAPVWTKGCAYGAWLTSPHYALECPDIDKHRTGTGLPNAAWRTNRGYAALNNTLTGELLAFDRDQDTKIDDWTQALKAQTNNRKQDDTSELTTTTDTTKPQSGPNKPPKAEDDKAATRPGRPVVVAVLLNDSDPNGDPLVVSEVQNSQASGGDVQIIGGGQQLQITPVAGRTAPVVFTYTVNDGRGLSDKAQVRVEVHSDSINGPPKFINERHTVEAGKRIVFDALRNVTDPDGDPVTLVSAALPSPRVGSISTTPTGLVILKAGGQVGTFPVQMSLQDDRGGATPATFTLVVTAPKRNLAPETHDDHLQVLVGADGYVDVLANDSDANEDPLTLTKVETKPGLTVQQLGGGQLRVKATKAGTWQVRYSVQDGTVESIGVLRVDAHDPSTGPVQSVVAVRDDAVVIPGAVTTVDVLANDIDNYGRVLVVQSIDNSAPELAVEIIDKAKLKVTPLLPLLKPTTVTYVVSDGQGNATGTVLLRPAPPRQADQPPVTSTDTASVRAGNAIPLNVLANDFDPEGGTLSITEVTGATNGTAFVQGNALRYLSEASGTGTMRLTYTVKDAAGNASTGLAIVNITPADGSNNHAPAPAPVVARVFTGSKVAVQLPLFSADPDGDPVSYTLNSLLLATENYGTVSKEEASGFVFQAGEKAGTQVLQYVVRDSFGLQATGTVSIGIIEQSGANQNPVAVDDVATVRPGGTVTVNVLGNDSDPDGDLLTVSDVTKPVLGTAEAHKTVVTVTVPKSARLGSLVAFGYGLKDGRGGAARAGVSVKVTEKPEPLPVLARDDLVKPTKPGTSVSIPVLGNDDLRGASVGDLVVKTKGGPSAKWDGKAIVLTMPSRNVSMVYTVSRAGAPDASALIAIPVASDRTPPIARADSATTKFKTAVTIPVLDNDSDPRGLPLSIKQVDPGVGGDVAVSGKSIRYTPSKVFSGVGSFTYLVTNGEAVARGNVTVKVESDAASNTPPKVTLLPLSIPAGSSQTIDLATAVRDAENDKMSFSGLTGSTGTINGKLSGSRLTVDADKTGRGQTAVLGYTVKDGHPNGTVTGSVSVKVTGLNKPLGRAVADKAESLDGKAVTIPVLANDDPGGAGPLSVIAVTNGGGGSVSHTDKDVTFTPAAGSSGTVSLSYTAEDTTKDAQRNVRGQIIVNVIARPSAPGIPGGTASSHQVALTWAASNGNGDPVSKYLVKWSGGGKSGQLECPVNSCTVGGLTNGPSYVFTVSAFNRAGAGPPSVASQPIKVDQVPPPPSAPTVTGGDQTVDLTWTNDSGDGSGITRTEAYISPGGSKHTVTGTTDHWTGLTNGTAYTFHLVAINSAGPSDQGASSVPVTPAGKPFAPSSPVAATTPNAGTVVVNWSAPDSNGAQITGYTLHVFKNGVASGSVAHSDVSNLQETVPASTKIAYSFDVVATNKVGDSPTSPRSNAVTPTSRPAPMGAVSASPGDTTADLSFSAPDDNGKPISSYTVKINGGATTTLGVSGRTVTGLANGTSYTFQVSACNADGCGDYSGSSNAVVPYGVPGSPSLSGSANGNTLNWNWSVPNNNGSTITGYDLYFDGGLATSTGGTSYSRGVSCGETHSVYVRAKNARGAGNASNTVSLSSGPCPTVGISKGSPKTVSGCSSSYCSYIHVHLNNFPGGSHSVTCFDNGNGYYSYTTSNVDSDVCVNGYQGHDIYVVVDGITSNHVTW